MTGVPSSRSARVRGAIDKLPSGAFRVRVYAGVDPVTKRRHDLVEVIPPGPQAERKARAARDRLASEVEQRRNPRTRATVDQLLERYLDQFDGAPNTLTLYRGYVRNHISPLLGHLRVGQLDAEALDSFYAELRRCRTHCTSRRTMDHRTDLPPARVRRPVPTPPMPAARTYHGPAHALHPVGRVQARGAVAVGVGEPGQPVGATARAEAESGAPDTDRGRSHRHRGVARSRLGGAAVGGDDYGRPSRGAVRRSVVVGRLHVRTETIWLRKAIRKDAGGHLVEAELKTHQQRRIALDPETVAVLREHHARCSARARALGFELPPGAFAFSTEPEGKTFPRPDGMTQRYERLASRLDIETTFHRLRHYSATELIVGGVDPRTEPFQPGEAPYPVRPGRLRA